MGIRGHRVVEAYDMTAAYARNWCSLDATVAIIDTLNGSVTPPAFAAYLVQAASIVADAATTPYVATGHVCNRVSFSGMPLTPNLGSLLYASLSLAPGSVHAKVAFNDREAFISGNDITYHEASTATGGMTGANVARVPWNIGGYGSSLGLFVVAGDAIHESANNINDAPVAPTNRLLELPQARHPTVEDVKLVVASGWSIRVVEQASSLESL